MSNWLNGFPAVDENSLRSHAEQILLRSQNLMERIGDVLTAHGVEDGKSLTFDQCDELVRAGIVIDLILITDV